MTEIPPLARRLSPLWLGLGGFALAAVLSLGAGMGLSRLIESSTERVVRLKLIAAGHDWASVASDGLTVTLTGTAQTEGQRFAVVNLVGQIVDSTRIDSQIEVTPPEVIAAPRFSVEMLRGDDGVQLIGLLPEGEDKEALTSAAKALAPSPMDMLETAAYAAPEGWAEALAFGTEALTLLPRSKISVSAEGVNIIAIAGSEVEKRQFEAALAKAAPKGLRVTTDISAPRPVLTPFTLRFVLDAKGARFDACSADTEAAKAKILAAAGIEAACTVGMGVPSPSWADATSAAIAAVKAMGGGTVTFSDADITLEAGEDVTQAAFDTALGDLRAGLPDVFSLQASMPEKAKAAVSGPLLFTATLEAKTHKVDLRGPLLDERMTLAVGSVAKAHFGASKVHVATVLDASVPEGWTARVFAGLDALAVLDSGMLMVKADMVEVTGVSGLKTASDRVSQLLSRKLGQGQRFKVDVDYDKALDPMAGLPTPAECLERVQAVMAKRKIAFDPGSAEIAAESAAMMDALAQALKNCGPIKMEIGGHTDAQGSAEGNLALSKARAQAVLVALQGRLVDVSAMQAVGFGEGVPVADNGTEAGRLANRRIEFRLIEPGQGDATLAGLVATAGTGPKLEFETGADGAPLAPQKPVPRPKRRPAE
ncbi:OmpA family protein [Stagnihabitans tardus]|uniref:OmpA family protein n=1 Tax=Stagnihabitans tardus TaxID=2699202 RepID=A0AAE4Y6R1_9RHOB|nr:OmpA family protein [Stagnihabitans tardus]NBZ86892.1 OmpA family protein [Stagnihabitans tardus]